MLLELQQRMEGELAEKTSLINNCLSAIISSLPTHTVKKLEEIPGADEVFNEAELVLDEHDNKLLAAPHSDASTKTKPKWKPLPAAFQRVDVLVDIDESDKVCDRTQLLEPLYKRLKARLLAEPAMFADETPLKVIIAEKETSYMWVYCCGSERLSEKINIVLYDYHNSRAAQCAFDFLDGYKAYGLTEAKLVACLAHIRRKFVDAKKIQATSRTGKVDVVLNLIGKLYGVE
jgi:hypothetical protein